MTAELWIAGFAAGLFAVVYWKARGLLTPLSYTGLVALTVLGTVWMLGRPKPMGLEWGQYDEPIVLGYKLVEGEAIYLMLDLGVPRLYVLDWSQGVAEQLLEAESEARRRGSGEVMMQMPENYIRSLETRERLFYALPQPPNPPKGGAL